MQVYSMFSAKALPQRRFLYWVQGKVPGVSKMGRMVYPVWLARPSILELVCMLWLVGWVGRSPQQGFCDRKFAVLPYKEFWR